jgi:hypothetical protein
VKVVFRTCDLDFRAGEVKVSGDDEEMLPTRGHYLVGDLLLAEQRPVDALPLDGGQAECARCICLRIEVDEQNPLAAGGKARREIDGGGRLADSAFLVRDSDDLHAARSVADVSGRLEEERCAAPRPRVHLSHPPHPYDPAERTTSRRCRRLAGLEASPLPP